LDVRCLARHVLTASVVVALVGARPLSAPTTAPIGAVPPTLLPAEDECARPLAAWVWCDDFERDRLKAYFEYDSAHGHFVRASGAGLGGSVAMRARFTPGARSVGALHLAIGKTPQTYFRPADAGRAVYRELFWRFFLRNEDGWRGGGGDKLTRAISFASSKSWAEAMIAHVWSGSPPNQNYLVIDPASGTDAAGQVRTTTYNDGPHLRWLGMQRATTPLFALPQIGQWHCIEVHVRLNAPGHHDGIFELWIDDTLAAARRNLDWVGSFTDFGINAIFLENYWNAGAPRAQTRDFDNFVVSTERVGCKAPGAMPLH
jgi:hypothetical protein